MNLEIYFLTYIQLNILLTIRGVKIKRYQTGDIFPEYQTSNECTNNSLIWDDGECRCPKNDGTFFINDDQSFGCLRINAFHEVGTCDVVYFTNLSYGTVPLFAYQEDNFGGYFRYANIPSSSQKSKCLKKKKKKLNIYELEETGDWKKLEDIELAYNHNKNTGGIALYSDDSSIMSRLKGSLIRVEFECDKGTSCFYGKVAGEKTYDITVVITYSPLTTRTLPSSTVSIKPNDTISIATFFPPTASSVETTPPQSTPVQTTSNGSGTTSVDTFGAGPNKNKSSQGTTIAIGVSSVLVLCALLVVFCIIYRRRRANKEKQLPFQSESPNTSQDAEVYEDISDGKYAHEDNNYASLDLSGIPPEPYGSLSGPPILKNRPAAQLPISSNKLRKDKNFLSENPVKKNINKDTPNSNVTPPVEENVYEYLPNNYVKYSEPMSPNDSKYAKPDDTGNYPMYFETLPEY